MYLSRSTRSANQGTFCLMRRVHNVKITAYRDCDRPHRWLSSRLSRRNMNFGAWLESGIAYGWELLRSAVEGARSAGEQIREEESPRSVMMRSARTSLVPGVTAATLGLATGYWLSKRKPAQSAVAFGLLGAVIGFAGGMAWGTRHLAGGMARGAIGKMNVARDAHWLAKHPVDYA